MQETIMSGLNTNQRVSKNFSISRHAGSGAVVAAFLGALWVLHYLATTQYGFSTAIFGGTGVVGFSLLEYTAWSSAQSGSIWKRSCVRCSNKIYFGLWFFLAAVGSPNCFI
jgi:hypothetical protein